MSEARSSTSHLRVVTWVPKFSSFINLYSSVEKTILVTDLWSSMYSINDIGWSWQTQLHTCYILGGSSGSMSLLYWKRGTVADIPQTRWDVSAPPSFRSLWRNEQLSLKSQCFGLTQREELSPVHCLGAVINSNKAVVLQYSTKHCSFEVNESEFVLKGREAEGAALTVGVSWDAV